MADWNKYKDTILELEGGYQKHPSDPGNYNSRGELVGTNHGISAILYERIIGYPPSEYDMRNITKQEAQNIFYRYYWLPMRADKIRSQAIAETFIDHGINAGKRTSVKMMQRLLNNEYYTNLEVDGIVGPKTLKAINAAPEKDLFDKFNEARIRYYESLGRPVFLAGWIARVNRIWEKYKYLGGGLASLAFAVGIFFL